MAGSLCFAENVFRIASEVRSLTVRHNMFLFFCMSNTTLFRGILVISTPLTLTISSPTCNKSFISTTLPKLTLDTNTPFVCFQPSPCLIKNPMLSP